MNTRSLRREELTELFEKFKDVPNINTISLKGYYVRKLGKKRPNPSFKPFIKTLENGKRIKIPTARLILHIPSGDTRRRDKPIALFTTGDDAKEMQTKAGEAGKKRYLSVRGKMQAYGVYRKETPPPALLEKMDEWSRIVFGERREDVIDDVLHITRLSLTKEDKVKIPLVNVWIRDIKDITEEVAENPLIEGENVATLSGLVYMPPSIRLNPVGGELHFKLRVKRNDVDPAVVPPAQQTENGYDIINVKYSGERAEEFYMKLKQGYPAKVDGHLVASRYTRFASLNRFGKEKVAKYLRVEENDNSIKLLGEIIRDSKILERFPSNELIAKEIDTNWKNW